MIMGQKIDLQHVDQKFNIGIFDWKNVYLLTPQLLKLLPGSI